MKGTLFDPHEIRLIRMEKILFDWNNCLILARGLDPNDFHLVW